MILKKDANEITIDAIDDTIDFSMVNELSNELQLINDKCNDITSALLG